MPKFTDALDRAAEDIKRPPNMPIGNYIWQITKMPSYREIKSGLSTVDHMCTCISACDDVDPDELAEFGNVAGQVVTKGFMFNEEEGEEINFERSLNNLKEFYERCGIDVEKDNMKVWMANSVNAQFMGELRHRPDKNDPEIVYQEIGRTAPV